MPKSFDPLDLGGDLPAETRQKRLLNRIAVLALLVVGAFGVWMMFSVMVPQGLPAPAPASGQQAGGTLPDEVPVVTAPAISASAAVSPTAIAPTIPPPAEPPLPLPAVAPDAAPPVHQGVIAQGEIPSPSSAFISQPLTVKTTGKHQFGVQMGVFRLTSNADRLHARMQALFVPVILETRPGETRVHAGPFASLAAAQDTRIKLEALGMGKGMLVILKNEH